MITVNLQDIIDEIDSQTDEVQKYLNTESGEILAVSLKVLEIAEEIDEEDDDLSEYPEWQREFIEIAIDVLTNWDSEKYIKLPDVVDILESGMMEDFCEAQDDGRIGTALYSAVQGDDAPDKFMIVLDRFGIEDDWFRFRDEALKNLAIEWCEENEIQYE